jgi:GntR family transcriptional regulator
LLLDMDLQISYNSCILVGTTQQPMNILNRSSYKPLYLQISDYLRLMIENGDLKPGDRVASENELVAQYTVSRNTARLAINALISQGMVYRVQGKGTFVTPSRLRFEIYQLSGFSEEVRRMGLVPSSRLLRMVREKPTVKMAEDLKLPPYSEVYNIERLRLANNEPMAVNLSYIPCYLAPDLEHEDLECGSLYEVLESKFGLHPVRAEQVVRPAAATIYEAELLDVHPGYPLLLVEGVILLEDGRPVEWTRIMYRGDRYEFMIHPIRKI